MKKLFTLLIGMLFMLPGVLQADDWTETFDDQAEGSYAGTEFTCAISGIWTAQDAGNNNYVNDIMGSPGVAINDDKAGAHITTPVLNTCGTVSFKYAYRSGSAANVFVLQKSTDGVNFTDLDTHTVGAESENNYILYSFDVDDFSSTVYIRILNDDQSGHVFVDDFTVTTAVPDLTAPVASFDPADAATDVEIFSTITVSFDESILNAGGTEVTDPASLVELRETDNAGTTVAFTATINDDKDEIVITPTADLTFSQLYYVAVKASVLQDASANVADVVQSSTFTAISATTPVIYVDTPKGGEAYYPGEEVKLDWTARNMGNITIYVSFDAGALWLPIVENIDPAPGTVNYTIPSDSPASLESMIRIAEATDLTFVGTVGDSKVFAIVPMISIYDIQSDAVALYEDTVCITSGVVSFAKEGVDYYISDGTGDYSAVVVTDYKNNPVVGDSVVIAGTVDEAYGLTNIASVFSFRIIASGKTVPAPIDMTTGGATEALEGVIVKLSAAIVVDEIDYNGETKVDDGSGVMIVDDPYYIPTLNLGGEYDITGPLSYGYSKWRVFPRSAADVVYIPSDDATVTSSVYTVDDVGNTITAVPALEELAAFKTNLTPAAGATFDVYLADGLTVATDLATGYKVIVTAEDGSTKTYTITKDTLSDDASVTSLVYTVDDGAGTIVGVLFKSTVASFEALLKEAPGASFMTYQSDGVTVATDLMAGYKLIVTAEDASTEKIYTITLDDAMPGEIFFSEYIEPDGGNSKAIEIFNPNDEAVRLDYYQIGQMHNGDDDGGETTPVGEWEYFHSFPVGVILDAHGVYVMVTADTDDALFVKADADEAIAYASDSPVHHTGDDARSLLVVTGMDTTIIDLIGVMGPDPGSGWDVAGITNATMNHTLVRKGTIMEGNADWASSAGTTAEDSEWIVKDANFWDSLGTHFLVLPEPSDDATLSALMIDDVGVAGFSPAQLSYYVDLDPGTTLVPTVTATATDDGLATVLVTPATDLGGNEAARTTTVTVTAEDGLAEKLYTILFTVTVGIENNMFSNVNVYPVPAMNELFIDNVEAVENLAIFDVTGAAVMGVVNNKQTKLRIDISTLNSGIYIVKMTSKEATGVVRFIKE